MYCILHSFLQLKHCGSYNYYSYAVNNNSQWNRKLHQYKSHHVFRMSLEWLSLSGNCYTEYPYQKIPTIPIVLWNIICYLPLSNFKDFFTQLTFKIYSIFSHLALLCSHENWYCFPHCCYSTFCKLWVSSIYWDYQDFSSNQNTVKKQLKWKQNAWQGIRLAELKLYSSLHKVLNKSHKQYLISV